MNLIADITPAVAEAIQIAVDREGLTYSDLVTKFLVPTIATLGGVIAFIYKSLTAANRRNQESQDKLYKETKEKLADCEEHHVEANRTFQDLREKIGKLEGKQEGIEQLGVSVLQEVRSLRPHINRRKVVAVRETDGSNLILTLSCGHKVPAAWDSVTESILRESKEIFCSQCDAANLDLKIEEARITLHR